MSKVHLATNRRNMADIIARFDLNRVPRDMLPLFNAVDELIA